MVDKREVIACHTVGSWKQQLLKGKQSNKLIVVDFTAAWCGPCRAMAPLFAELANKMSSVIFLKVDVDELTTVAAEWGVSALPCFVFLKNGNLVDRFVGARRDVLQKIILQHA
ncbi:thioredoxin H1-like [Momordica charantia]|uniref:Thioredoxin H1-like n=1 Tax=Momordica charantia TaxID=3673 RepID=A0A6J1DWZ0_MOMCH|nr:thioredoxin H1-like [Momordica charantia]XP_022158897.1 thioredoxin H1-like [Momordica charantia]